MRTGETVPASSTRVAALLDTAERHARLGAFAFPTPPRPAAPLATRQVVDLAGTACAIFETYVRHTAQGTIAGVPGLTIPAPVPAGALPVGLALDAPAGTDRELLGVGALAQRVFSGK